MAFEIDSFDRIEFDIPAGRDKKVTLSVPPLDCFAPEDVAEMNKQMEELDKSDLPDAQNPLKSATALIRFMVKYFNPGKQKADAIDSLVPRQLNQIDKLWTEESGIDLGESVPSTDESTQSDE